MLDREALSDFVEAHRNSIIVVLAGILVALILTLVLVLAHGSTTNREKRLALELRAQRALKPADLFLPPEPLELPGVILSREPGHIWTEEDAFRFFIVPDLGAVEALRSLAQLQIDEILESVP